MDIFYGICYGRRGGVEGGGVLLAINVFFRISPWLSKRDLDIVWALYYIHIVVEVTMNMAEYTSSCQF